MNMSTIGTPCDTGFYWKDGGPRTIVTQAHKSLIWHCSPAARLLVFDQTLAQLDFAVVNCFDVVMSVFYARCFNARPDIFAVS